MAYVISHCQNGAYVKLKSGKGSWATLLKNATKFQTMEKATNFIENNFPGTYPGISPTIIKVLSTDSLAEDYVSEKVEFTEEAAKEVLGEMISFYEKITENTERFLHLPDYFGGSRQEMRYGNAGCAP